MNIQLDNQPQDGEVVEIKSPETTSVPPDSFLLTQRVAELFDMKPSEVGSAKTKLNTLIDYAKTKTKDHSPDGIKWAIRSLAVKVGTPPLGEKLINYLTRFAYLSLESNKINSELNKFIANNNDNN